MQPMTTTALATATRAALICVTLLLLSQAPVAAKQGEATLPVELSQDGWKLLSVPGKAPAHFAQDGPGGIRISAENAVAFLYRPVPGDMGVKRRLAWRWRVDEPVPLTDLSIVGQDDRTLAVHLVFPLDPKRLSFFERVDFAVTRIFAPPLAGKVLTYVWGGTQARGEILANPHLEAHGRIIVLRSGTESTGRWFMEEIDFAADFRKAFGYSPPQPIFLMISSDSDDTAWRCVGVIADLTFI